MKLNIGLFIVIMLASLSMAGTPTKDYLSMDTRVAEKAVERLKKEKDSTGLMEVLERGRQQNLRVKAAQALGDTTDKGVQAQMVKFLRTLNTEFVEGGTEQAIENAQLKEVLLRAVARAVKIPAPESVSIAETEAFIQRAARALEK